MNKEMMAAWLEISDTLGEPTREELDVFLRTWQRAIQAEREECAKACEDLEAWNMDDPGSSASKAIRARGQA